MKTIADDRADTIVYFPIRGNLGLINSPNFLRGYQLAMLRLAGKHESPWVVLLGGALALTSVTALGVIGGQGLCRVIPERMLLWISAVAFVVMKC